MTSRWPEVRLGNVLSLEYGKPLAADRRSSDGKYVAYGANGPKARTDSYHFDGDSIIIGRKGSAGELARVSGRWWPLDVTYYVVYERSLINIEYLYYALQTLNLPSFARGVKPGINRNDVYELIIPLPPLDEQKRIVAKLDEAREVLDRMRVLRISKGRSAVSLESALLADIVSASDPTDFEVDLGEITSKIGSGATPRGGSNSYLESGISLIRSLNVHDAEFRRKNLAFISNDQAKLLANVKVDSGDVLLNITGASIARTCVVPADLLPARVNQHVAILRARPELVHPDYLALVMVSEGVKQRLLSIGEGAGTTRQALTKLDLMKFSLRIPRDLNVQERRVSYAQSIQGQIARFQRVHNESLQRLSILEAQTLAAALKGEL